MTTIIVRNIIQQRSSLIQNVTNSINIDTTGIISAYQLLITLFVRTEMFLRINGEIFIELAAAIYFVAIRNGEVVVYFLANLPSTTGELDAESNRCELCCTITFANPSIVGCIICTAGGSASCG